MSDFSFELIISGSDPGGGVLGALATSEDGSVIVAGVDGGAGLVNVFTGDFSTYSRLTASDGASGDRFGYAVACSSDASVVVSGAWYNTNGGQTRAGAGYVYSGTNYGTETKLTASDAQYNGFLGWATACSADGSVAVLGANKAAYVYSGTDYQTETKLTGPAGSGDFFGYSVACSADGSVIVVGAFDASPDGVPAAGAVYVYSGANWGTETRLTASDKAAGKKLGNKVACSADGNTIVACAAGSAAYIFSGASYGDEVKVTITETGGGAFNTLACTRDADAIYTSVNVAGGGQVTKITGNDYSEQLTGTPNYSTAGFAEYHLAAAADGTVVYAAATGKPQGDISAAFFETTGGDGWGLIL